MINNAIKNVKRILTVCTATTMLLSSAAFAGFTTSGTDLLDANGNRFIMRGVNHAHTWYVNKTNSAIPDIARTGANTVRVVLSNGTHGENWQKNSANDVKNIIKLCKDNKLVCVLEVHDTTGGGEKAEATSIAKAADYWVEIKSALQGEEDYIIINIANEPIGNGQPASKWINDHKDAVKKLRNAGLTHTLMIDAPNWGQDWKEVMLNNADQVADADKLSNIMFSVHMYQVYQSYDKVNNYLSNFMQKHNLPIIVGEFGDNHQGEKVAGKEILEISEQLGTGYLGWSWSGNGDCCIDLDVVKNFQANNYSTWGDLLINSKNGIKATSKTASIYGGPIDKPSSSSQPSIPQITSSSSRNTSSSSLASASSPPKEVDSMEEAKAGSINLIALFMMAIASLGILVGRKNS